MQIEECNIGGTFGKKMVGTAVNIVMGKEKDDMLRTTTKNGVTTESKLSMGLYCIKMKAIS